MCLYTQSIPHTSVWLPKCFCSAKLSGIYGILATSFSATLRKGARNKRKSLGSGRHLSARRRHSQQNRLQKRAADFSVFILRVLTELCASVLLAQLHRPSVEAHQACSFPRGVIKPKQSVWMFYVSVSSARFLPSHKCRLFIWPFFFFSRSH